MKIRKSLSRKILVSILLVSSMASTVITLVQLRFDFAQEMNGVQRNMKIIEDSYLPSLVNALWNLDKHQIVTQLEGILNMPDIVFVEIRDNQGKKISQGQPVASNVLSKEFPLVFSRRGERSDLGTLFVAVDMREIYAKIAQKLLFIFFSQLVKTMVVITICYFVIRHVLTRHLIDFAKYLNEVDFSESPADFTLRRASSRADETDELDVLASNINRMKASLVSSYRALKELNESLELKVEQKTQVIYEQSLKLEQSAKMSALGEMAGGVAHEINNPLGIIKALAGQLQELYAEERQDPEQIKVMLGKIEKTVDRIAKIVHGLRTFSRDGSGDPLGWVNVRELMEETLSLCGERFKNHSIKLDVEEVPADKGFRGRATEMSQVLLNLLNNAHDAIVESPSPDKWIRVSVRTTEECLEICVADSGPGIPPEIQKKIFQPFFTTKQVGKGTGMGLSISQGIVRNMGGELTLDNSSSFTCFVIRLPKLPALT